MGVIDVADMISEGVGKSRATLHSHPSLMYTDTDVQISNQNLVCYYEWRVGEMNEGVTIIKRSHSTYEDQGDVEILLMFLYNLLAVRSNLPVKFTIGFYR